MFFFLISSLYFLLIILLFALFGNLILRLLKINFKSCLESFLFSITFSLSSTSLLIFTILLLNLEFLVRQFFWLFIILGFLNSLYLIAKKKNIIQVKIDWVLLFISLTLTILMASVTVRSGWRVNDGLEFFGVNAHDGLWHLSLIGELKNHFPPQHPNFQGIYLKDYHYLLDLLLAKFSETFGFSEADLYFRFFPLMAAALWCFATFLLAQQYFQNKAAAYLTIFFSVLGGSFAYLLPIFYRGGVNLDSDFGVSAPIGSLINLQFALSIPVLTLTFYAFAKFLKKESYGWGFLVATFICFLFGLKIYAGMIALFAIGLSSALYFIKSRRIKAFWVAMLSAFLGWFIYSPTITKEARLVFAPGEMIQSIIRGPLSWTLWELQRQVYDQHHNLLGLTRLSTSAFLVFLFGNLGTKFLGLIEIIRFNKSTILTKNFGLLFFALLLPFFIPLFFIQSITPFNIVQFWWYFLYLMSFLTASVVWGFLRNRTKIIQLTCLLVIFIFTTPAAIFVLRGYLSPNGSYKVPNQSLKALAFLKQISNPSEIILEVPLIIHENSYNFGLPVIPAISQRRIFLGQEIIEFPYLDRQRREEELTKIVSPLICQTEKSKAKEKFCSREIALSHATIVKNNINYIYSTQPLFWLGENSKISSLVYNNEGTFIYRINQ